MKREVPRAEKVERYRQLLIDGHRPPPVTVVKHKDAASGICGEDRRQWLLIDGHNRVAAARAAGRAYVEVVEREWPTRIRPMP